MKYIAIIVTALLINGCASSKRMMRLSPINKSRKSEVSFKIDHDRVNLWPLMYHKKDFTSVLWPMIDIDDKGVAVRPLYNQDEDEYSILFPFSAWNPKNDDGWVMPGYWNEDLYGVVPLFHISDGFNYIGPIWWKDDSYGVLISGITDELYFLGPLWSLRDSDHVEGGFFPLARLGNPDENWVFPLYHHENGNKRTLHTVLLSLLARFETESNGDYNYWALPVLLGKEDDTSYMLILPFGMYQKNNKSNNHCYWLLPWLDKKEGESLTQALFPFYLYSESKKEKLIVTPICSYGWGEKGRTLFNLLGAVYHHDISKKESTIACLWPLSYYNRQQENVEWCSFPLISSGVEGPFMVYYDENTFALLGPFLFKYDTSQSYVKHPFYGIEGHEKIMEELKINSKPEKESWETQSLLFFTNSHSYSPDLFPYWDYRSKLLGMDIGGNSVIEEEKDYFMFFGTTHQKIKSWRPQIEQADIGKIKNSLAKRYDKVDGKSSPPQMEEGIEVLKKYNYAPKDSSPKEVCKAIIRPYTKSFLGYFLIE